MSDGHGHDDKETLPRPAGLGYHCDVIAPSLIPTKPGVQREHDRYDASRLARRGLVFRAGKHWTHAHLAWPRALAGPASPLEAEDVEVLNEYLALFDYTQGRCQALDQRVAALAHIPSLRTAVAWLQCFRGFQVQGCHGAADGARRLAARSLCENSFLSWSSRNLSLTFAPGSTITRKDDI